MVESLVSENMDVNLCCDVLGVSRGGYYSWLNRPPSNRKKKDEVLVEKISQIHQDSRKTYGAPRIHKKLNQEGEICGYKKVVKLMRLQGISGTAKKKYKVQTTDSKHDLPIAERLFKVENVEEQVTKPNQVWASDITYIPTNEGWVFLCIFLDLFTRKVVGFSMGDNMRSDLLIKALDMAIGRQTIATLEDLLSHTDRGSVNHPRHTLRFNDFLITL